MPRARLPQVRVSTAPWSTGPLSIRTPIGILNQQHLNGDAVRSASSRFESAELIAMPPSPEGPLTTPHLTPRSRQERLMVLIPHALSDLVAKGEVTERYYNPGDLFREVHIVLTNDDRRPPAISSQRSAAPNCTSTTCRWMRPCSVVRWVGARACSVPGRAEPCPLPASWDRSRSGAMARTTRRSPPRSLSPRGRAVREQPAHESDELRLALASRSSARPSRYGVLCWLHRSRRPGRPLGDLHW